jgi:uncharacterized protein YigA (DUF484 family)
MSTKPKASIVDDGISDEAVAYYLESHPEFFERHGRLLASLSLPHATSNATVSLIERQVALLRERNRKLERRLNELIDTARNNDRLADAVQHLALRLLGATTAAAVVDAVEISLREDFTTESAVLVLIGAAPDLGERAATGRFLRLVAAEDPALKAFANLRESGAPRCGQIRDSQRDFLFGEGTDEIGSAALLPLGPKGHLGLLAIGSVDSERFHPGMSTDFLGRIANLVTAALQQTLDG